MSTHELIGIYDLPTGSKDLIINQEIWEEFKQVIKRGTAFGTQTSPEMKRFADTLLGRISYTSNGDQLKQS